jgi:hypothetical protein
MDRCGAWGNVYFSKSFGLEINIFLAHRIIQRCPANNSYHMSFYCFYASNAKYQSRDDAMPKIIIADGNTDGVHRSTT